MPPVLRNTDPEAVKQPMVSAQPVNVKTDKQKPAMNRRKRLFEESSDEDE